MQGMTRPDTELPDTTTRAEIVDRGHTMSSEMEDKLSIISALLTIKERNKKWVSKSLDAPRFQKLCLKIPGTPQECIPIGRGGD